MLSRFFYIALLAASVPIYAQKTSIKSEKDAVEYLKKIDYWVSNSSYSDTLNSIDSIYDVNKKFIEAFTDYLNNYPVSLVASFKELKNEGISVANSADKKIRIYSWDTWTGGTMHYFSSIIQYKTSKGTKARIFYDACAEDNEGDSGAWYDSIYMLKTPSKTYYLALSHSIYSSIGRTSQLEALRISADTLIRNIELFKTEGGISGYLGFEYELNYKSKNRPRFRFDLTNKIISLPIIKDGDEPVGYEKYKFNGKYFVAIN